MRFHFFLGNLLENTCCCALTFFKVWLDIRFIDFLTPGLTDHIALALTSAFVIEGIILFQTFLSHVVYAGTERLHANEHSLPFSRIGFTHIPVAVLSSMYTLSLSGNLMILPTQESVFDRSQLSGVCFSRLLCYGFLVYRTLYDITFYATHRGVHSDLLYDLVHAKHHAHKKPTLVTNYQFTIIDLFGEAVLPMIVAVAGCSLVFGELTYVEVSFWSTCAQWYQIGSHSAKALPVFSAVPPLSILYNYVAVPYKPAWMLNHHPVRFHHTHHRLRRKNYGITPWIDWMLRNERQPEESHLQEVKL